jgi:S1-C subfamily serine protease
VGPLGLVAGDVIVAIDGRLVVSRAMFLHLLADARTETRVTVRRRGTEKVLHFVER